jgi:5-bromo-4-chloroindolyl phosphate hydrolysis protein
LSFYAQCAIMRKTLSYTQDRTADPLEEAMRSRDYTHIGRRVSRAVRDAVRSGNYEDIGRAVGNGVHQFTDDVNEALDGFRNTSRRPPRAYAQNESQNGDVGNSAGGYPPPRQGTPAYQKPAVHSAFRSRMPGSISGLVYAIIGSLIGIPLLIVDITVFSLGVAGFVSMKLLDVIVSILTITIATLFGMMIHGITLRRRARRFARYRDAMGGAAFCKVAELADTTGETQERTKKDLKRMIASGACPQGHLDRGETCFMMDDETYGEYLEAEKAYAAREEAARAEEQKEQADPKEAELAAVKKEGNGYLQQIRSANDALLGKEISEKLDRLENVAARIFACVEQHPEKLPDIRRFMRYYMPTTLKLVKSYEEFEKQPMQGENITKAKEEIDRALDTVNTAFGNLLDTLFADDALDVSTDISTLETMLKQEGLTGSDFAKAPDDGKLS